MMKKNKIVEIVGPSFHNKGDSLMAYAIEQRLGSRCILAYDSRAQVPRWLWRPVQALIRRFPRLVRSAKYYLAYLLPYRLRLSFRIVNYKDIWAILDCSGFQYGDQWIKLKLDWRINHYKKIRIAGGKVIMLPQAFGPFQSRVVRERILNVLESVDLVFARDKVSAQYLKELKIGRLRIKTSPDFTNLIPGKKPSNPALWADRVCLVPNARMVDMTRAEKGNIYIYFLLKCISSLRQKGLKPVILLHENTDHQIAEFINNRVGEKLAIIDVSPIESKGILGCCHSVISSRYHALASSLSQGALCLGTSWAHKYLELFKDYGCPECLFESLDSDQEIEEKIHLIIDPHQRTILGERIRENAEILKRKSMKMWEEVEAVLDE
jgi:polysaccharide pyruvyl transferase WcaK-like protein